MAASLGGAARAGRAPADPLPSLDTVLDRARASLLDAQKQWSVVICEERYVQQVWAPQLRFGTLVNQVVESRQLTSEFIFVWVPAAGTWTGFRDVVRVDGHAVPDREKRLESLLQKPGASLARLGALADESARYNIGPIVRNFNEPTLALRALGPGHRDHFTLRKADEKRVGGRSSWEVEFSETGRPTVIQRDGGDAPVRGRLWIDPARGVVLRTELRVEDPVTATPAVITVDYVPARDFGVWMPRRMKESYKVGQQDVTGVAEYSRFRRFETGGRLVLPK